MSKESKVWIADFQSGKKRTKKQFAKIFNWMLCQKHEGKMEGIVSISTSGKLNGYCDMHKAMMPLDENHQPVCKDCYANRLEDKRDNLSLKLADNTAFLGAEIYPVDYWPVMNYLYFRFESFGDVLPGKAGYNQICNYFNLCRRNPETRFALWTKNPVIIDRVLKSGVTKPVNLQIVFSSYFVNRADSKIMDHFGFIDKVFTVYDKKSGYNDGRINCGAKHCRTCLHCYKDNGITEISEKLKK